MLYHSASTCWMEMEMEMEMALDHDQDLALHLDIWTEAGIRTSTPNLGRLHRRPSRPVLSTNRGGRAVMIPFGILAPTSTSTPCPVKDEYTYPSLEGVQFITLMPRPCKHMPYLPIHTLS